MPALEDATSPIAREHHCSSITNLSLLLRLLLLLQKGIVNMASNVTIPNASRSFVVIVAATAGSLGIGKNGSLPWRLAADMAYFKRVTSSPSVSDATGAAASADGQKVNAVIMGRKTWQSIPDRFRPLQGRRNVVLSRNPKARDDLTLPEDVLLAESLPDALALLARPPHASEVDKVFVIGGGSVYTEAVASDLCEKVLLTSVGTGEDGRFEDCDVHFPTLDADRFKIVRKGELQEEKGVQFSFDEYEGLRYSAAASAAEPSDTSNAENDKENSTTNTDASGSKRKINRVDANGTTESSTPSASSNAAADGEGNEEEMQYLSLVEDILNNGVRRGDRTGTGTLSKFGVQMRFNLREGRFPLLTTKRVFWRGVAEELLWFVSGCTNANVLKERGVHIWDGNGSREFLDG